MSAAAPTTALARAQAGDADAFRELTEPHRRELLLHCYRLLGSLHDAEDVLQETLLAAWRGLPEFESRASLRTWLYRIATNRCLNALRRTRRRAPAPAASGSDLPTPTRVAAAPHVEPFPDALVEGLADPAPGPEARLEARETVGLAFVVGLQRLPPRQRAAIVLRDVLGFRAAEAAQLLGCSEPSSESALQRARASLAARPDGPWRPGIGAGGRDVARRFADALEAGDVPALLALLDDDASLAMPPLPFEYDGPTAVLEVFTSRAWWGTRSLRTLATAANGQPAFAYYVTGADGVARLGGLVVLTLAGDRVIAVVRFPEPSLHPAFGLAQTLPSPAG